MVCVMMRRSEMLVLSVKFWRCSPISVHAQGLARLGSGSSIHARDIAHPCMRHHLRLRRFGHGCLAAHGVTGHTREQQHLHGEHDRTPALRANLHSRETYADRAMRTARWATHGTHSYRGIWPFRPLITPAVAAAHANAPSPPPGRQQRVPARTPRPGLGLGGPRLRRPPPQMCRAGIRASPDPATRTGPATGDRERAVDAASRRRPRARTLVGAQI